MTKTQKAEPRRAPGETVLADGGPLITMPRSIKLGELDETQYRHTRRQK